MDNNGIRADDIKTCDETTKEMIIQIFNEVLKQEDCTPETWREIRIKVICKKGNLEDAGDYRLICTLPALYKLFSTIIYNRLYSRLDQAQPEDQGGFRRSYAGPSCNLQTLGTEMPGVVYQNVGRDSGRHEGI